MKLKNKIFLIFAIFLCVVSSFITFSQASYDVEFEGNKYTIPDIPDDGNKYKIVCLEKTHNSSEVSSIKLFTSNEKFVYGKFREGYIIMPNYKLYSCSVIHGNTNFSFERDCSATGSTSDIYKNIVYSNYDVYDKNDKLVFQKAPPAQMVSPMEVGKVEELPTLIIQIVEMIIPAFLIIFGILLVLYLIKSKNLLQL